MPHAACAVHHPGTEAKKAGPQRKFALTADEYQAMYNWSIQVGVIRELCL